MIKAIYIGLMLFASSALLAQPLPVDDIVRKANHSAYYQGQDGKASLSMVIVDSQGRERKREFTMMRKDIDDSSDGAQRFYVFFKRPSDINKTAFLVWKYINGDDDRWMYLPALDLVKRIAASDERTSFVGSHFFYEDVSGRTPSEDAHSLVEETEYYYVVKSTPKIPSSVEFSYYKNWIYKASFLPVKTEFYDESGKAYRTYEVLSVENIDGFQTVTAAKMTDVRIGGYTEITYSDVQYNINLNENLFTERYLRTPPTQVLR